MLCQGALPLRKVEECYARGARAAHRTLRGVHCALLAVRITLCIVLSTLRAVRRSPCAARHACALCAERRSPQVVRP